MCFEVNYDLCFVKHNSDKQMDLCPIDMVFVNVCVCVCVCVCVFWRGYITVCGRNKD